MKEDDEDEEEAIESVPRLPNTFCKFLNFLRVLFGYRRYLFACLMIYSESCHEIRRTARSSQFW
jgi:hypothetical protein